MPTHYKGKPEEVQALNTYIKLSRAMDSVQACLLNGSSMKELTISQFGTMEALYHLGPLCQNELGSKILKSNSNMTTVIDNLEKRGLVRRERDTNDRRMIIINLTDTGKQLIESVFPEHTKNMVKIFSALSNEEQKTLGDLLRKLGKSINN
ncbi:MAG: MarR family transcriptional regulator [Anaerolineaceae bacterium]|nr:MarR family transcriptional regulator [Anaerolineaceae bacterium]